jgi:hypothetical protein
MLTQSHRKKLLDSNYNWHNLGYWISLTLTQPELTPQQLETAVKIAELSSAERASYYVWEDKLVRKPKSRQITLRLGRQKTRT